MHLRASSCQEGQLELRIERPALGVAVLYLKGRLHAGHAEQLRKGLQELIAEHAFLIVVDMGGASFVDSTVLSVLVSGLRMAREKGGRLVLARVQGQPRQALTITLLDRVFRMYPSVEEAVQALTQGTSRSG